MGWLVNLQTIPKLVNLCTIKFTTGYRSPIEMGEKTVYTVFPYNIQEDNVVH